MQTTFKIEYHTEWGESLTLMLGGRRYPMDWNDGGIWSVTVRDCRREDLKEYGYDEKANTFDFAIAIGLGYEFDFGMTIDARYNWGLTKIYEDDNAKNSVFMISLGYKFDF